MNGFAFKPSIKRPQSAPEGPSLLVAKVRRRFYSLRYHEGCVCSLRGDGGGRPGKTEGLRLLHFVMCVRTGSCCVKGEKRIICCMLPLVVYLVSRRDRWGMSAKSTLRSVLCHSAARVGRTPVVGPRFCGDRAIAGVYVLQLLMQVPRYNRSLLAKARPATVTCVLEYLHARSSQSSGASKGISVVGVMRTCSVEASGLAHRELTSKPSLVDILSVLRTCAEFDSSSSGCTKLSVNSTSSQRTKILTDVCVFVGTAIPTSLV